MDYRKKTKEQSAEEYRRIKEEIRILDLAEEFGYTPVRKGRYYSLAEHDSVRIDPDKNWYYRNSTGKGNSCIGFAVEFGHYDNLHAVLKDFTKRIGGGQYQKTKPASISKVSQKEVTKKGSQDIELPQRDSNVKNVFAYLVKTRGIDKNIVSDFIAKHRLYQDVQKNCVFVDYDKDRKPTFANLRGTNQYQRFLGDISGSDYNRCFYIDNKSKSLVVTESIVDAMSVMTFKRHINFSENNDNYLALSSSNKYKAIMTHLEEHPEINEVKLMLDNDSSGKLFTGKIKEMLNESGWKGTVISKPPFFTKDWNDELKHCQSAGIRYDYHSPSKEDLELLEAYCIAKYECYTNGMDPRAYTRAKKQKEDILEKVAESDLPQKIVDYADSYYDNTDVLERYPHDGAESAQIIMDHYNHKSYDFSDVEKLKSERQDDYIRQISKVVRDATRDLDNDIGVGD